MVSKPCFFGLLCVKRRGSQEVQAVREHARPADPSLKGRKGWRFKWQSDSLQYLPPLYIPIPLHSKGQFVCICPFPVPVKATKSHPICPTNMETGKIGSSSPMPGFFYTSTNKKSQIQKIFERLGLLLLYQNIQRVGANAVT